jgi:hypothetical protein
MLMVASIGRQGGGFPANLVAKSGPASKYDSNALI